MAAELGTFLGSHLFRTKIYGRAAVLKVRKPLKSGVQEVASGPLSSEAPSGPDAEELAAAGRTCPRGPRAPRLQGRWVPAARPAVLRGLHTRDAAGCLGGAYSRGSLNSVIPQKMEVMLIGIWGHLNS